VGPLSNNSEASDEKPRNTAWAVTVIAPPTATMVVPAMKTYDDPKVPVTASDMRRCSSIPMNSAADTYSE
jgi:hypothetical protein